MSAKWEHPASMVRAILKAKWPNLALSLSVKQGRGTAYCWTEIRPKAGGMFTPGQYATLEAIGIPAGGNVALLDAKDARAWLDRVCPDTSTADSSLAYPHGGTE